MLNAAGWPSAGGGSATITGRIQSAGVTAKAKVKNRRLAS